LELGVEVRKGEKGGGREQLEDQRVKRFSPKGKMTQCWSVSRYLISVWVPPSLSVCLPFPLPIRDKRKVLFFSGASQFLCHCYRLGTPIEEGLRKRSRRRLEREREVRREEKG
jgi:hypothetical protein